MQNNEENELRMEKKVSSEDVTKVKWAENDNATDEQTLRVVER